MMPNVEQPMLLCPERWAVARDVIPEDAVNPSMSRSLESVTPTRGAARGCAHGQIPGADVRPRERHAMWHDFSPALRLLICCLLAQSSPLHHSPSSQHSA